MKITNQEYIDGLLKQCGIKYILDVVIFFEYYKTWLKKEHYKKAYDIFRNAFSEQMGLFYNAEIEERSYNTLMKVYKNGYDKKDAEKLKEKIKILGELFI